MMRLVYLVFVLGFLALGLLLVPEDGLAQRGAVDPFERPDKLPNGKSQKDAIVNADHKKNQEDSVKLAQLGAEIRDELAEQESHIVSVTMLKKIDEIDRLTHNIRGRLKRN